MLIVFLSIGSLFTAGFVMMVWELVKAPFGFQDEHGFHELTAQEKSDTIRVRSRRVRRRTSGRRALPDLKPAHAR